MDMRVRLRRVMRRKRVWVQGLEMKGVQRQGSSVKETWDVYFEVTFGGLRGEWGIKGLVIGATDGQGGKRTRGPRTSGAGAAGNQDHNDDDDDEDDDDGAAALNKEDAATHWKRRFLDARARCRRVEEEVEGLKERVLDVLL
ncbi:predicted protein [Plenodomus lingam JN3]|uniref:Predicted protein n=1 Tax=Leptosphaeria maculans (strain JN3 / isolate v23.1.3 / race Av1-4-5-6-7-8) TaxID=985895 RepID=E4ZQE2_LEPMJ|nr:predicted protein [Plenodomus lingam JN3]CBX93617.1 predicted protein [Plenodomus lingam JN3]